MRLTLCACMGRLPAVAQLLGDCPSWFLGAGSHLCPPLVLLVPEGTATMPHPLSGAERAAVGPGWWPGLERWRGGEKRESAR